MKGFLLSLLVGITACEKINSDIPIQKCCGKNEVLSYDTKECVPEPIDFTSDIIIDDTTTIGLPILCQPKSKPSMRTLPKGKYKMKLSTNNKVELFDETIKHTFDSNQFCIEHLTGAMFQKRGIAPEVALVCGLPEKFCKDKSNTCVQFCCSKGKFLDPNSNGCTKYKSTDESHKSWKPDILKDDENPFFGMNPRCPGEKFTIENKNGTSKILPDGSLNWHDRRKVYTRDEYCVTRVENGNEYWEEYHVCSDKRNRLLMAALETGVFSLLVFSMIFLVLTFGLLYVEQRDKLFGCMMLSTIVMLFLYYLSLAFAKKIDFHKVMPMCEFIGLLIQFSQMSAFFWLNSIGYHVWSSFRKFRDPNQGCKVKLGIFDKRFKWYALYAWGFPLLISTVTLIMQKLPEDAIGSHPGIGKNKQCTLEPTWGKLFYFHMINGPVMLATLGFLMSLIWTLIKSRTMDNWNKMKPVLKISIIMGPMWIFEMIAWAIGNHGTAISEAQKSFTFFNVINSLQGVFIFLAFLFNRQRVRIIKRMCNCQSDEDVSNLTRKSTRMTVTTDVPQMEMKKMVNDE